MNIAALLERTAIRSGGAVAVLSGQSIVTSYEGLARRSFGLANSLLSRLSLGPGARVAVYMGNRPEYLEVLYAIWAAGLIAVPVNSKLHAREVAVILEDCGAAAIFSDRAGLSDLQLIQDVPAMPSIAIAVDEQDYALLKSAEPLAPVARAGDDIAWLFYTSGTTGRPKGVMLSHHNLLIMTLGYAHDVDPVEGRDAILYAAPVSHGAGMYNFVHVLAGARHVFPESGGFDAGECFSLASTHGRVSGFMAPTMVNRLVDHAARCGATPEGFKTLVYGGGPMYTADLLRALDTMGPRFVQIYGQGECPMAITSLSRADLCARHHPRFLQRIASVGTAQCAVQIRIAGAGDEPLACGQAGEIMVRGEPVMRGYWNNAPATATTLRGGWLATGDIGSLDQDGYLTLIDRSKDLVISGGSNIYPREVEEVLLRHGAVQEVCVVGRPDREWGEELVAAVVLRPGHAADAAGLDRLCLAEMARFKRPKAYCFVAELPKSNYGKILKREVREWLGGPDAPALIRV